MSNTNRNHRTGRTRTMHVALLLRELFNGDVVGAPVADPSLVAYGADDDEVTTELTLFLEHHLSHAHASTISRFVLPEGAHVVEIDARLDRPDLPRRLQVRPNLALAALVLPVGGDTWVYLPAFDHTFYLDAGHTIEDQTRAEAARLVSARETTPTEYLALLPPLDTQLVLTEVTLSRLEHGSAGDLARKRRSELELRRQRSDAELLGRVGTSMAQTVRLDRLPPLVGRAGEVTMLRRLLDGSERMSVMVVGSPLSGKTRLIQEVALTRSPGKKRRPVIVTSGAQLVAGQTGFGQWQERLHRVMVAAERVNAILYFDNLADLFAGQTGGIMDLASAIRPYIEDGRVSIVGELSAEDAELYSHAQAGLFSCMSRVTLEPLDAAATVEVVRGWMRSERTRNATRPRLDPQAVRPLVDLAERYLPYRAFPGKATRFVEELRARVESTHREHGEDVRVITREEVYDAFSIQTGIPAFLLREDIALRRHSILDFFSRRVIGQREALERVADTICVVKASLQPPRKPLATFLFVGPTGVGKTEVARQLSSFLFGDTERLVRLDMSEYMDPFAAERLVHGTDREEGVLTRAVRQQPFCAILLDEIEKAHPAVFDLLLQVLGEGRLTDARGKTALFHNAIIIMTSNLGAAHRRDTPGFGGGQSREEADRAYYLEQVRRTFRPELVNRIDRVIPFQALAADEIHEVARVTLARITDREGFSEQGVLLDISDGARAALATKGYDAAYGARALRRVLDDALVTPAAALLARYAGQTRNARLVVRLPGEPVNLPVNVPDPEHGTAEAHASAAPERYLSSRLLGHTETDTLTLALYRGPARSSTRELRGVDAISAMRRDAARLLAGQTVQDVHTERDYLLAQLNYGNRRSRKKARRGPVNARLGRETSALQQKFHRLEQALQSVREPVEELETIEELAIASFFEGERVEELREEADLAHEAFREALLPLLVAKVPEPNAITLHAVAFQRRDAWSLWLLPLLEHLDDLQWSLSAHIARDPFHAGEGWPEDRTWGPPRSSRWLREQAEWLADVDRCPTSMLLRVRGPLAGVILRLEDELHRWTRYDRGGNTASLHIRPLIQNGRVLTENDWKWLETARFPSQDELKRMAPQYVWDGDAGTLTRLFPEETLRHKHTEYWSIVRALATDCLIAEEREGTHIPGLFTATLDTTPRTVSNLPR